jgi:hypothetical protein
MRTTCGGRALWSLSLTTRWQWVASFTSLPLYLWVHIPGNYYIRGWVISRCDLNKWNSLNISPAGNRFRLHGRKACRLFTAMTKLSHLLVQPVWLNSDTGDGGSKFHQNVGNCLPYEMVPCLKGHYSLPKPLSERQISHIFIAFKISPVVF